MLNSLRIPAVSVNLAALAPAHNILMTTDRIGRRMVGVLLRSPTRKAGTAVYAWLLTDDYRAIVTAYGNRPWHLNAGSPGTAPYVRIGDTPPAGLSKTLARFIVKAKAGEVVRYADGDRLNLRPENLLVVRTGTRGVR